MIENKDGPGDRGLVMERAGNSMKGVGEAEVEPDRRWACEGDPTAGRDLLKNGGFIVREVHQFGGFC